MPNIGEAIIFTETGRTKFELVDGNVVCTGHSGNVTWRRAFSVHSLRVWIANASKFLAEVEAQQATITPFWEESA